MSLIADAKEAASGLRSLADSEDDSLACQCNGAADVIEALLHVLKRTQINSQDFASLNGHISKLRLQLIWERIQRCTLNFCERCRMPLTASCVALGKCSLCHANIFPQYQPAISPALAKLFRYELGIGSNPALPTLPTRDCTIADLHNRLHDVSEPEIMDITGVKALDIWEEFDKLHARVDENQSLMEFIDNVG